MREKKACFFILAVLLTAMSLGGCGYGIRSQRGLPFTEVSIGRIENKTLEPKLQDRLHRALTEEFMKQGISVSPGAAHKLTGVIHTFAMAGLSEKGGIIKEYRVMVSAAFRLVNAEEKTVTVNSPFIVPFTGSDDLGRLIAAKETAEEEALKDIAMEVVGALIYQ